MSPRVGDHREPRVPSPEPRPVLPVALRPGPHRDDCGRRVWLCLSFGRRVAASARRRVHPADSDDRRADRVLHGRGRHRRRRRRESARQGRSPDDRLLRNRQHDCAAHRPRCRERHQAGGRDERRRLEARSRGRRAVRDRRPIAWRRRFSARHDSDEHRRRAGAVGHPAGAAVLGRSSASRFTRAEPRASRCSSSSTRSRALCSASSA